MDKKNLSLILQFFALLFCISTVYGNNSSLNGDTIRNLKKLDLQLNVVIHNVIDKNKIPAADSLKVLEEIKNLNIGYAPIGVSFIICDFLRIDRTDITVPDSVFNDLRYLLNSYGTSNALNLFFVHEMTQHTHNCSFTLGNVVSEYPSGIFISCISKGDVLHEMGHFFGLLDTFGNGKEFANGSNCNSQGDLVCDTPADPFKEGGDTSAFVSENCIFHFKEKDENKQFYFPDVSNPMGPYTKCRCPVFTREQYSNMVKIIKKPEVW